jgi:hypothetical protein
VIGIMGAPGGVEPPTNGLGNRCSIQLSYGATCRNSGGAPSVYRNRFLPNAQIVFAAFLAICYPSDALKGHPLVRVLPADLRLSP